MKYVKAFNEYEQKILQELIRVSKAEGAFNVLGNVIEFALVPNFYIELHTDKNSTLRVSKTFINEITKCNEDINKVIEDITSKLQIIVDLFKYLEKAKLIYLKKELPIAIIGKSFGAAETPVGYIFKSNEVERLLNRYSRKQFSVTRSLKRLEGKLSLSNYKGAERPDYSKKSYYVTLKGLYVNIVGVFIAFLALIYPYHPSVTSSGKDIISPLFNSVKQKNEFIPQTTKGPKLAPSISQPDKPKKSIQQLNRKAIEIERIKEQVNKDLDHEEKI